MATRVDANESGTEFEEFLVPEFGAVNLAWFDFSRKYRGAIFRLSPDAAKQIAEILSFTANFEHAGVRTASADLFKTEGRLIVEIERNTKPTDLAVRYSRDRWNLQDTQNKPQDKLRPWIKSEYRAKYISEKVIGLVAEQLKMSPDNGTNFIFRINFKERTFGLLCDERFAEQMPTGSFSPFVLPNEAMLAVAAAKNKAASEERSFHDSELEDENAVEEASSDSKEVTSEIESSQPAGQSEKPIQTESRPEAREGDAPPGSTRALEKFITRKEDRQEEQIERRDTVESSSAKYATYSRSEVDQMLKQQTENITNALGAKISSQQRVFQEAVDKQEKAFSKLSDGFVAQFDQTRQKLESAGKQSEQSIHSELENFKRELSKELEQYRAQINKSIVPVAKFIEDKNTKAPEKAQKEVAVAKVQKEVAAKAQPAASAAESNGLRAMLIMNIILTIINLMALFVIFMPMVSKMDEVHAILHNAITHPPSATKANSAESQSQNSSSSTNSGTHASSDSPTASGTASSGAPAAASSATHSSNSNSGTSH